MLTRCAAAFMTLGLATLAGCGPAKLDVSKTLTLESGDAQAIDLDGQPKPQKLTVVFTSAVEVSVSVFKEVDAKGETGLLNADPSKALGHKRGTSETFTADVPENTATRVVVREANKKTDVQLKITNQK